jgi:hypothetical protein
VFKKAITSYPHLHPDNRPQTHVGRVTLAIWWRFEITVSIDYPITEGTMTDDLFELPEPVRSSRWRLAIVVSVVLGGSLYLALRLDCVAE